MHILIRNKSFLLEVWWQWHLEFGREGGGTKLPLLKLGKSLATVTGYDINVETFYTQCDIG